MVAPRRAILTEPSVLGPNRGSCVYPKFMSTVSAPQSLCVLLENRAVLRTLKRGKIGGSKGHTKTQSVRSLVN